MFQEHIIDGLVESSKIHMHTDFNVHKQKTMFKYMFINTLEDDAHRSRKHTHMYM